jgi:hypothetical protein
METIVKATCPACGDVELAPEELKLRVCSMPDASTYHFVCTNCRQIVVKSAADERVVQLLSSVGVPVVNWDLPAELSERHDGEPITLDELIDLHELLDRPDWAVALGARIR